MQENSRKNNNRGSRVTELSKKIEANKQKKGINNLTKIIEKTSGTGKLRRLSGPQYFNAAKS